MEEFQTSYNGFLNFLGYDFWSHSFYERFHQILLITTIYGKSHDQNIKTLKTQTSYIFPNKTNVNGLRIQCILIKNL